MKLHQTIKNLYLSSIKFLFSIEVQTDGGWNQIDSLNITEVSDLYQIETVSIKLLCTKNHILIDENGDELLAIESRGRRVKTINGIETIVNVTKTDRREQAYDLSLHDGTNHLYYANGLLSHNCVVMDESAFVPNNIASKVFESIYPVISSSKNSQFIIVSTPNGADPNNLYYEIWQKATSKAKDANTEGWKPFRFDWWDVPGRDEQWKKNTIASIGETRFAQEFGNVFLATSDVRKLIPDEMIEKHRMKMADFRAKKIIPGKDCNIFSESGDKLFKFTMWHEFDPSRTYVASGDIAEGLGGDNSVLYVWDITSLQNIKMCAKFASNQVSLVEFAYIARKMLSLYNDPYFIAERNGISGGMLDSLRITYKYPRLVNEGRNGDFGVYSHVATKAKACLWAREMMTTDGFGFTIYDQDLIDEFSTFVKKDSKGVQMIYHALPPAHDDFMMSFIWLCYLLQSDIIEKYFVVCSTFTSQLGNTYARDIAPQQEYSGEDIKKISQDPIYQDFINFRNDIIAKLGQAAKIENQSEDIFNPRQKIKYDPYFGDIEESYRSPSFNNLNPNNFAPPFFIN